MPVVRKCHAYRCATRDDSQEFEWLCRGGATGGAGGFDDVLARGAALFKTDELGAGFSQYEGADACIRCQPVHRRVDDADGDGRAGAAVHFFFEVAKHHARCRQRRIGCAHDVEHRALNIAIRDDGAGTDDHV